MTFVWIILGVILVAGMAGMVVLARRRRVGGSEPRSDLGPDAPAPSPRLKEPREVEEPGAYERPPDDEEPRAVVPQKPEPSPAEVRAQAEELLADSDRLLTELRELSGGGDGGDMVELLAEGLDEVRAVAGGGSWGQAKDKAEALRAQLAMMVQSAKSQAASE